MLSSMAVAALSLTSTLNATLESMAHLHGDATFNPAFKSKLAGCLKRLSLSSPTESFWNGFVSYALSNGQPDGSDPWGENATYHHWMELNATKTDLHGITVFEPCNWVSNVAYYHAVTAVCDKTDWYSPPAVSGALAQSLAMLAAGSAFYHASGTILGGTLDNIPISIISYLGYRQMVSPLPTSTMIHWLSNSSRKDATQLAATFVSIVNSSDPTLWQSALSSRVAHDAPDYFTVFAAMGAAGLNLLLPTPIADSAVRLLCKYVLRDHGGLHTADFLINQFQPAFLNATAGVRAKLTLWEKIRFGLKTTGVVLKLAYAFEEIITGDYLKDAEVNKLGGVAMPYVNMVADALTGYKHADDVRRSRGVYPGDDTCREGPSPHAKWHEQSAQGLMDLMYLMDDASQLIASKLPGASLASRSALSGFEGWLPFWSARAPVDLVLERDL